MIRPWRTLSSRTVLQDRWLTVRADACEMPSGHVLDPFYVVERGSWAAIVALTADRRVVLTREYRHGAGLVALGLPGGGLEPGETPQAAAARELLEETGYACAAWRDLGTLHANWRNQTNQLHVLLGLGAEPVADQTLDAGEDIEVVLAPWEDWLHAVSRPPAQAYYVAATLLAERSLAADPEKPE